MSQKVKLGNYISITGGGTPNKANEAYWNGQIPWMSVKDLKGTIVKSTINTITPSGLTNSAANLIKKDSLIIATRMAVGKVVYAGLDTAINQDLKAITVSPGLYHKYLFYQLKSKRDYFERNSKGATVKGIKLDVIRDLEISLPPLEEQKKIAAILDAADDYRQKTKALIDKYDQLTQSLFLDMFGDPVTNPMGWDVKTISKLTDNFNSQRVPLKSSNRAVISGNIPYYGASGIIDFVDDYTHDGEYVLIGEDGANLISRNKPIAFLTKGKIWVNNHAHVLKNTNESRLEFIEFLINSIDLEPYVTGSAQPKLNKGNLDRIKVYAPPVCLQDEFAERVSQIEKQKQQAETSLVKAEELFNSLLQKAFKGELTN